MDTLVGQKIRDYEIRELIGQGGYGAVYRANESLVSRDVAIKVILPEHANQEDFIRNFEIEAKLVARLEHPFIVPLYQYWRDTTGAYLVMRFFPGGNLADVVRDNGPLSLEIAVKVLEQIASALSTAHRNGIAHRDLKPHNILLDANTNAYLTDFGIAMPIGQQITGEGVSGTLHYMAPEQLSGEAPALTADIYSLGFVLYEMLLGKHPYHGLTTGEIVMKHLTEPLPIISQKRDGLSPEIDMVIDRMTAKRPEDRYQEIMDAAAAFRDAVINQQYILPVFEELSVPSLPEESQTPADLQVTPNQILAEHLAHIEEQLFSLYEQLASQSSPAAVDTLKSQIASLRKLKVYRERGLAQVKRAEPLSIPLSLRPPEQEFAEVERLHAIYDDLKSRLLQNRSVSLVGPAGVGKSVLASALTRDPDIRAHFENHIFWLTLGAKPDLDFLMVEILRTVGISDIELEKLMDTASRTRRFHEQIADIPILIVVDDVWDARSILKTLVERRNRIVILATTRRADIVNDFPWEAVHVDDLTIEQRITFLTHIIPEMSNFPQTVEFARRIGGLPRDLALVARKLRGKNTGRLEREINRITANLASAVEPGFELLRLSVDELSELTRQAFKTLAILPPDPNSISEDAAEEISTSLDYLDELEDASLIKSTKLLINQQELVRYVVYPSFAEYARTHLAPDDSDYRRVVEYFIQHLVEHADEFEQITLEKDNIESALQSAVRHSMTSSLITGALALYPYWKARGMIDRAELYLREALKVAEQQNSTQLQQARLYYYLAQIEDARGDVDASEKSTQQGLQQIASAEDDTTHVLKAELLSHQARILFVRGDFDAGFVSLNEAFNLIKDSRHYAQLSQIHNLMGTAVIYGQGDFQAAKGHYTDSLAAARRAADEERIARVLRNLAQLELRTDGSADVARNYLIEASEIARKLENAEILSDVSSSRAHLEAMLGNLASARAFYEEAIDQARKAHETELISQGLVELANLLAEIDEFDLAEKCLSEALDIVRTRKDIITFDEVAKKLFKIGALRIVKGQAHQFDQDLWDRGLAASGEIELDDAWKERLTTTKGYLDHPEMVQSIKVISWANYTLGLLERDAYGDLERATLHFEAAFHDAMALGDTEWIAQVQAEYDKTKN